MADRKLSSLDLSGDNELPALLERRAELVLRQKQDTAELNQIRDLLRLKLNGHKRAHLPGWTLRLVAFQRASYTVPEMEISWIQPRRSRPH